MSNSHHGAPPTILPRMPTWAALAIALIAGWFLTTHFLHVFSELVNWDEFALLDRAQRTLRFGKVIGDGRAGLVTVLLTPFVKDCVDAVRSVVAARIAWQFVTLAYLVGVYFLVRRWFALSGRPWEGHAQGLIAVALLAFLPSFVVWSVQVRTDQAALAAVVWGGVLLLATSYRTAVLAGILFGVGVLCTQKGVYTIGLVGVLWLTATAARVRTAPAEAKRETTLALQRILLAGAAAAATVAFYAFLVPSVSNLASQGMVASSVDVMRFTRATQGYRVYTVHAGRLLVHWALFGILIAWSLRALWIRDRAEIPVLGTCWLALLLGLAVIMVHGSSFPYFIMTAGLFPALALSMASARPLAATGRSAWPIVVAIVALAAAQSLWETVEMLADTQQEQRDTLRLVYDSPLKDRRGYQVEGALMCMRDPEPIPPIFTKGIVDRFYDTPHAARNTAEFTEEFRRRPIAYIVESYRLLQFPQSLRQFWSDHYVWYAHSLYIAGFDVSAQTGPRTIDVLVPGKYRWDADPETPTATLDAGNVVVPPGGTIELAAGPLSVRANGEQAAGQLILADLPRPERVGYPFFYHRRMMAQLGGYR